MNIIAFIFFQKTNDRKVLRDRLTAYQILLRNFVKTYFILFSYRHYKPS